MAYINIRGTSGAGKTTLARQIMDCYENSKPLYVEGRKRPIAYLLTRKRESFVTKPLVVLGSYESTCGGVDTIPKRADTFKLIRQSHKRGFDVLAEGVVLSDEVGHTVELVKDDVPVLVIGLMTPLERCLENINSRRRKKNPNAEPVNPDNTSRRIGAIERSMKRLDDGGVKTIWLSYEEAFEAIQNHLGLTKDA